MSELCGSRRREMSTDTLLGICRSPPQLFTKSASLELCRRRPAQPRRETRLISSMIELELRVELIRVRKIGD